MEVFAQAAEGITSVHAHLASAVLTVNTMVAAVKTSLA